MKSAGFVTVCLLTAAILSGQDAPAGRDPDIYQLIGDHPAQALRLAESRRVPYGEWKGRLEATVEDDFEHGKSRTVWRLRSAAGEQSEVYLTTPPPSDCGGIVSIRGIRSGNRIAAAAWSPEGPRFSGGACSATTGPQSIAVIMVQTPASPLPSNVTAAALQTAFFGSQTPSLDLFWRETSFGQTSATGSVFGPFTLDANYTCDQSDQILTATINAADSSVNWTQFQRIVMVIPNVGTCAIGFASVGCRTLNSALRGAFTASTVWLRSDFLTASDAIVSVASHELGHNWQLQHSSTLTFTGVPLGPRGTGTHTEYGDYLSVMGLSFRFNGKYLLGHYNAPHKNLLGWFPVSNVQTVAASGTYTVAPLESPTGAVQALRVRRFTGNQYLWIEFRRAIGYDATLGYQPGYNYDGALIHDEDPTLPYTSNYTHLLNFHPASTSLTTYPLAAGESWADPNSNLSLQVNSALPSALSVTVNYATPCATLSTMNDTASSSAQQKVVNVTAPSNCSWNVASNASWITILSALNGAGSGTVSYSITANTGGAARTGTLTIANQDVTLTQSPAGSTCTYAAMPASALPGSAGGSGSFNVNTSAGCAWTASTTASWINIISGSGPGPGTVNYSVLPNAGRLRTAVINIGPATYSVTQSGPLYSPVRDFRGSGSSDVFVYDPIAGAGYAGLSNGQGAFGFVSTPFSAGFDFLRTIDFTGDGKSDLIVYRSTDALGYSGASSGTGTFNFQSLFWSPGYSHVEPGDFNQDGKGDIFLYRASDGTSYTALSNGDGTWNYKYALVSIGFTHVRVLDVNGDGKSDVFLYRSTDGAAFLGIGNGDGTFVFTPVAAGPGYDTLQTGDINADGKADIVLYSTASGAFKIGLSTGSNFSFTVQSFSPGFTAVRLLDVNGDGRADLALYNSATAIGYLGIGNGAGSFAFGSIFWGPGFDNVEPQDVNGDGYADVILYNSATGTAYTGISNGSGGFTYVYSYWGIGKRLAR